MDSGTVVAFYSGATWMVMPYAPAPVILRYFELHRPDFVVVNRLDRLEDDLAKLLRNDTNARSLFLNLRSPLTVYEWGEQDRQDPRPGEFETPRSFHLLLTCHAGSMFAGPRADLSMTRWCLAWDSGLESRRRATNLSVARSYTAAP